MLTTTESTVLDNGVRVISEKLAHNQCAAVSILINASPKDEEEHQSGLAHLTEHALFLGTPQRSASDLARLIDSAGGCFGAFTAPDYTCFYAHVLEDYASYAFDMMGDILVASDVPDELLEREKQVIRQEIAGVADSHEEILLELTKNALWPNDELSRSITGDEENVLELGRSDVLDFIRDYYTPDQIIVAAAGAIDHHSIVEQTQDAFWMLEGKQPENSPSPPTVGGGGVQVETRPSTHCSFSVAIPTPAYAHDSRFPLHVINNLLGGGLSSRLYRALREAKGLVYSIQSEVLAYRRAGMLVARGTTTQENLVPCVVGVLNELMQLAVGESPVDDEELWVSKRQVRSQSQLATDLVSNRVARISTQQYHFGERISDEQILTAIDQVTIDDVQNVSRQILLSGLARLCISVVGPVETDAPEMQSLREVQQHYASFGAETASSEGIS